MTFEDRQRIRAARDQAIRAERAAIMDMGKGRCKECTSPHDEYTPGCVACRDRERIRGKRAAGLVK